MTIMMPVGILTRWSLKVSYELIKELGKWDDLETLPEMKERHRQERINLVKCFADTHTQTQAASQLGVSMRNLNNFIRREKINWKIKAQGRASHYIGIPWE